MSRFAIILGAVALVGVVAACSGGGTTPTLAEFSSEPYMRKLKAAGHLTGPKAVTLDGLPAFRYEVQFKGVTAVTYELLHGGFAYQVNLGAPTSRWDAVAPELDAVAQTFAVSQ